MFATSSVGEEKAYRPMNIERVGPESLSAQRGGDVEAITGISFRPAEHVKT
jgi:hypothetical protein